MAGEDVRLKGVVLGGLGRTLAEQLPLQSASLFNGDLAGVMRLAVVGEKVAEVVSAVRAHELGDGEADVVEHFGYLPFLSLCHNYITQFVTIQPLFLLQKYYNFGGPARGYISEKKSPNNVTIVPMRTPHAN